MVKCEIAVMVAVWVFITDATGLSGHTSWTTWATHRILTTIHTYLRSQKQYSFVKSTYNGYFRLQSFLLLLLILTNNYFSSSIIWFILLLITADDYLFWRVFIWILLSHLLVLLIITHLVLIVESVSSLIVAMLI